MVRRRSLVASWAVLVLATVVLAAVAQAPSSNPASGVRVLYPANRTVHVRPTRVIVATPLTAAKPIATLDGKPFVLHRMTFADSWLAPGKLKATAELVGDRSVTALWASSVRLAPGPHVLMVAGKRLDLRGATGTVPAGWTTALEHSPVGAAAGKLDCGGCHEMTGAVVGTVPTPKACATCHDDAAVQLIHRHITEPLARCAMCHDPHGSARPKLLTDAKEKLCSKCHAVGHSKS